MNASELRPKTWLSNEAEAVSVVDHGGEVHCHVRLYADLKNLSAGELCGRFGARRANPDEDLHARSGGGGATMRWAWLIFGPDDTVLAGLS